MRTYHTAIFCVKHHATYIPQLVYNRQGMKKTSARKVDCRRRLWETSDIMDARYVSGFVASHETFFLCAEVTNLE
jgi:hypothetical protein